MSTKKKPEITLIASNLKGESAFFPGYRKDEETSTQLNDDTKDADTSSQDINIYNSTTKTSLQGNKETSFQDNKFSVKQESKATSKRSTYPKVTYQLNPLIIDMLEDTKRALKRQDNVRVTLAEIVEEAVKHACKDLQENKKTCFQVYKKTGKQGSQQSRKQENKRLTAT